MSIYICPACQREYDEDYGFCHECGGRLVEKEKNDPALNLGDANAISGGVSINQSKNITSHDTHYHTTTVERVKSESELKLEATNQLRAKAEEIMAERGRIDSFAMNQLRPLSKQLGIDDEIFKSIIKDVRSNRDGVANGLRAADARYLQQAQHAVLTNDMEGLSNLTHRLEAMAAISQDENVQYLYYLTYALQYPIKSMEVYERQTDENYWRTFWAIVSYIRTGKHAEADNVLPRFDPLRYEKSEEDRNLLEAYNLIMRGDKDGAQEFLDEILGEPTEQVKPLLRAVESTLYEEEPESLEVRFYMERVMSKSDVVVKSQKKTETPPAKELESKQLTEEEAKVLFDAVDKKTDPNKLTDLQHAAEAGDVWGMYFYARLYTLSDSVNRNYELAVEYYTKAANAGNAKAMCNLGVCYDRGDGVNQDYAEAARWYRKGADAGNSLAMNNLGTCYRLGTGVNQDLVEAAKLYRKGADAGNALAMGNLGVCYENGKGVNQDYAEAARWYRKGADAGNALAMGALGVCYENGKGVNLDYAEAAKWYRKAADAGNALAMCNLGVCYENGKGVNQDYAEAAKWYRKAADAGNAWAMGKLGLCYENGNGVSLDISEAIKWYRKGADAGNALAMGALGLLYLNGTGVNQSDVSGFAYVCKAAEAGDFIAMTNVGSCYEFGRGVEANPVEAMKWYQKALDNGYQMNDWLSQRMEECKAKLPSDATVKFPTAWVTQGDDTYITIHFHFIVHNHKDRNLTFKFYTESLSPNSTKNSNNIIFDDMSDYTAMCIYDNSEWKDYSYDLFQNIAKYNLQYGNGWKLKTTMSVYDDQGRLLGSAFIKYIVNHESRMLRGDKLIFVGLS